MYDLSFILSKDRMKRFIAIWIQIVLSFLLIGSIACLRTEQSSTTKIFWPLPKAVSVNAQAEGVQVDPCAINYEIKAEPFNYIRQMVNTFLIEVFQCKQVAAGNITLNIVVKDPNQMVATTTAQQKYTLKIGDSDDWELLADCYVGFLRAFQTFTQLFEKQQSSKYMVYGRPITIDDEPDFIWRGIMIDTSRHFQPVQVIKHTIDGMLYNKMNILHWHITDEDSFPMEVPKRPELSDAGKVGGTFTQQQITSIINYAKVRGIRVIPEFDTPAHTQSWGRSESLKDIIVNCNDKYQGQFDPTIDLTYQVLTDVMEFVNSTFVDDYVHFGGDQIDENCWQLKQTIYEWMESHNITTYQQLQIYYRQKQRALYSEKISNKKKVIYWANEQIDLPVTENDVIHWWGVSKNVDHLKGRKNEVILSNYDKVYLDVGFGSRDGNDYGTYISWRNSYSYEPRIEGVNVIGGEACLWSELSNKNTMDQKLWVRASAVAERLWNVDIDGSKQILNISQRLVQQAKRMKQRGFKTSVVSVGLCEKDPSICFG